MSATSSVDPSSVSAIPCGEENDAGQTVGESRHPRAVDGERRTGLEIGNHDPMVVRIGHEDPTTFIVDEDLAGKREHRGPDGPRPPAEHRSEWYPTVPAHPNSSTSEAMTGWKTGYTPSPACPPTMLPAGSMSTSVGQA